MRAIPLAIIAAVFALSSAEAAASGPAPYWEQQDCRRPSTTQQFRRHADRVFHHEGKIPRRAKRHLSFLVRCRPSARLHRFAKARVERMRAARYQRRMLYCGTATCNRRLGERLTVKRFGSPGWNCLAPIIDQESAWRHNVNYGGRIGPPGRGAYGIPQALPPSKMASHGADWATNPRTQIRWLLDYVAGRYGGPCGALSHKHATGWY